MDTLAGIVRVGGHLLLGGVLLAMKGVYPHEEIADLPAGWQVREVTPLSVPGLAGERHLVTVTGPDSRRQPLVQQRVGDPRFPQGAGCTHNDRSQHTSTRHTRMARIIAIANQKGGVGKTTTAVNLAASWPTHPSALLLVDLDSQGNATMGSGVDKRELAASTYDLLLGESSAADVRVQTAEGYDLLPGNIDLTAAEIQLMAQSEREQRLKRALAPIRDEYDYILIDCPPALSLLTLNALAAADSVIVPMQCEYYALEGLSALVETIEALRANLNPALEIEGVLRTMFDVRNNLANAVSPSSPSTSAIACSAPSCRATFAWPRHPAMARASSATTAPRAVAWPTWAWLARSSAATTNATRPPRPWRPSDDQQQAGSQEARPHVAWTRCWARRARSARCRPPRR